MSAIFESPQENPDSLSYKIMACLSLQVYSEYCIVIYCIYIFIYMYILFDMLENTIAVKI